MNSLIRFSISGFLGIFVVVALVYMMLYLLRNDEPTPIASDMKLKVTKYHPPIIDEQIKPTINTSQKKKLVKPNLIQAPSLEVTERGEFEQGIGREGVENSLGSQYGNGANKGNGTFGGGVNLELFVDAKIYSHPFKFPKKAKQAGITEGMLIVRMVFNTKGEFQHFEILDETGGGLFRDVLYQVNQTRIGGHIHFATDKRYLKKQHVQHKNSIVYKFLFDINSSEPVRFYCAHYHSYE